VNNPKYISSLNDVLFFTKRSIGITKKNAKKKILSGGTLRYIREAHREEYK
jgi:hypothetical protein